MGDRRGRKLGPIDGCGPAAQFGRLLRAELQARGTPSREQIATAGRISSTTVSTVDNGRQVPAEDNLRNYLTGLGVPESEHEVWLLKRSQYADRAERLHPPT